MQSNLSLFICILLSLKCSHCCLLSSWCQIVIINLYRNWKWWRIITNTLHWLLHTWKRPLFISWHVNNHSKHPGWNEFIACVLFYFSSNQLNYVRGMQFEFKNILEDLRVSKITMVFCVLLPSGRLHTAQRAIKQTQVTVQRIGKEIEEKLRTTATCTERVSYTHKQHIKILCFLLPLFRQSIGCRPDFISLWTISLNEFWVLTNIKMF